MKALVLAILSVGFPLSSSAFAVEEKEVASKVKYKSGKDVNFEELLIQGQIRRAEISVVTGNNDKGTDGLLRLREDFLDRVASDQGEETP